MVLSVFVFIAAVVVFAVVLGRRAMRRGAGDTVRVTRGRRDPQRVDQAVAQPTVARRERSDVVTAGLAAHVRIASAQRRSAAASATAMSEVALLEVPSAILVRNGEEDEWMHACSLLLTTDIQTR